MSERMLNVRLLGPTSLGRPVEQGLRTGVARLPKLILSVYAAFQEASEVCAPRAFRNTWAASGLSGCIFPQPTLYSCKLQNQTATRTSPHAHTRAHSPEPPRHKHRHRSQQTQQQTASTPDPKQQEQEKAKTRNTPTTTRQHHQNTNKEHDSTTDKTKPNKHSGAKGRLCSHNCTTSPTTILALTPPMHILPQQQALDCNRTRAYHDWVAN